MRILLTKQKLCQVFGLQSRRGICYYAQLRKNYFSHESLKLLNITIDRYNAIKGMGSFTWEESERIIKHFDITKDELE